MSWMPDMIPPLLVAAVVSNSSKMASMFLKDEKICYVMVY